MTDLTNDLTNESISPPKEDPLELLTCEHKMISKYLLPNKSDELYNIYIKLLGKSMREFALHKPCKSTAYRYVLDPLSDMDSKVCSMSLQLVPVMNDYDLNELENIIISNNPNSLLQLAKKWNCPSSIDHDNFFTEANLSHNKLPIYNVQKWGLVSIAAQHEIKTFLMMLFPDITNVTKVRRDNKNYVCIYSNKYHDNDTTYLNTFDFVALWTNCARLFSGQKLINFDYSDWEVNMYGNDLMDIYCKTEEVFQYQKKCLARQFQITSPFW